MKYFRSLRSSMSAVFILIENLLISNFLCLASFILLIQTFPLFSLGKRVEKRVGGLFEDYNKCNLGILMSAKYTVVWRQW